MADKIVTAQKLKDADKDCDALDQAVNGGDSEYVKTRRGKEYPTMPNAIRQIMENGGFMPFATEAELLVYMPNISPSAAKAMDTKKVWLWDGLRWNNTGDSELDLAKQYVNTLVSSVHTNLLSGFHALTEAVALSIPNDGDGIKDNSSQNLHLGLSVLSTSVHEVLLHMGGYFEEKQKLERLMLIHNLSNALSNLDGFDPANTGSNKYVETEHIVVLPTPNQIARIDIETTEALPNSKGPTIKSITNLNVDGQILQCFGTLSVQGSSSAVFPKKNWTLAFFSDEARENAINIKLGNMLPHDELVFKANFVDNTQCRNIAVNRLWDQMQLSRNGYPKREVDYVNMINNEALQKENFKGLDYEPTGATGHVDGYPCVMYINNEFYGIGTLNIGKKRGNYNLKKNNQKHIQLESQGGGLNLQDLPSTPTGPASSAYPEIEAFEIRRPAEWGSDAQASYDRFSAFLKLSVNEMRDAGIDNYLDRHTMFDYIILLQVADLWDHLGKNTLYTTWDGKIWHFLPYDVDTVFGLYFTGIYFNAETGKAYRPATNKLITSSESGNTGVISKFRKVYGEDIDARYAELRGKDIISVNNIMSICEEINRKFPNDLFSAEDQKWNKGTSNIYTSLMQTGSLYQIYTWLTVHMPVVDSYFNYQS
ncbi:CotH kinase family protein [Acinetobacter rudis]|uniref:CotH kinase family protein n=1 Tax=Acinetobacter rudis TaxID=632955 RepID=UPI00280D3A30|nr:CotH kinase family protein [Acinetobacter rudis]MDQ8951933.1 CotH kinase family protein [Acinetobacter rudis]